MVYIGRILGSETKIKILFTLVTNPKSSYMEREIAKESMSSISEVNRQISDLVNSGLVMMQRLGNVKVYSINVKHFLFLSLQNLFINLNKVYRKIALEIGRYIVKKDGYIQTIVLVGSLARGKIREDIVEEPSDIDLIFIAESDKNVKKIKGALLEYIDKKIFPRYGITIYPFIISRQEYIKRLNKEDIFILKSHTKGEVIYGEKPRRFS